MATTRLERLATEVHALLAASGADVPHTVKRKDLDQHQARRRMAWVSTRGQIKKAVESGGGEDPDTGRILTFVAERYEIAYVYLYAESEGVCEQMLENAIAAILTVRNQPVCTDYRWVTQELRPAPTTTGAQVNQAGGATVRVQCIELGLSIPMFVTDEIRPLSDVDPIRGSETVTVETVEETYEIT